MGKIYMIGSQKGGVGKTTTTLNLAYSLQAAGKRVLMVDFDSQANLTTCFGLENTGELENTIGHLMVMTMEDEDLPTMKKCVRVREGVALLPSSIYLSVADAKLRLEAAKESGIRINKTIAERVRNTPLTQQAIREAVTGVRKEEPYDPAAPCVVYKPIKLSADIREKYFPDTEMKDKDVERTIDKALAAWFRKRK